MNKKKSILSLIMIIAILLTCITNTYAEDTDKMILELKVGSTEGRINGTVSKVEKPYVTSKTIMVPLGWITTAFGAEINQKANKKTEIIYGDLNAEITVGDKNYTVNSETQKLTVAPVIKNNIVMIPLEFITKNFPVTVTSDIKKGNIKIVLNDDGALSDLSFLTGGIGSPKVGNSYYGWSLNVPSGSRIISNSFKSDKIGITTESRGLYFEISVESKKNTTLSELYNDVLCNTNGIRDSKIDLKAAIPYFQYIRLSEYDEALRVKVFEKGEYFYYVTINNYDGTATPEQLISDKFYESIMSSFSLSYKGNAKGIQDVSKVREGKVSYYNYINLSTGVKYLPWSLDIPVKWDQVFTKEDPFTTNIGLDSTHYMKIVTNTLDKDESIDEYVEDLKNYYDKNFNPKVYTFISSDSIAIAGTEAQNLRFSLKQANKVYIVDEFYFIKDGFIYEISIKLPESEYDNLKTQFIDAINKMKFYTVDESNYLKDLERYKNNNTAASLSSQDEDFDYLNKKYKWSAKIPGYWIKSPNYDYFVFFQNPNSNANVMVIADENTPISKALTDEERFSTMKSLKSKYGVTPTLSTSNDKGYQVRTYTYKIEDEADQTFATVVCNCFESDTYSYCYVSFLPELTATEAATKELDNIWKSFKLTE